MRTFYTFLGGLALGAALMWLSFENHFVVTDDGLVVVSKSPASLSDTFADIRGWSLQEWSEHAPLAKALIQDGRAKLIGEAAADDFWKQFDLSPPIRRTAESPTDTEIR